MADCSVSKNVYPIVAQIKTIYRFLVGGYALTSEQKESFRSALYQQLNEKRNLEDLQLNSQETSAEEKKLFSPQWVKEKTVCEGKDTLLLVEKEANRERESIHFAITPKEHKVHFESLSPAEYLESMHFVKKLATYYSDMDIKLFHKNGRVAGQTLPQWYLHVIFTPSHTFFSHSLLTNLIKDLFTRKVTDEGYSQERKQLLAFLEENILPPSVDPS